MAAADPHDSVGSLDQSCFDARFFTEFERFDRHLAKLRRGPEEQGVALSQTEWVNNIPTPSDGGGLGWGCF